MEYRQLGRTGLRISEIGFGCGNIGGLFVRGARGEQLEAVRRAINLGINYFDTAPTYGDGQSESNLGEVLQQIDSSAYVGTKFRIDLSGLSDISGAIKRSLEASLTRLRRDYVDILQLHNRIASDGQAGNGSITVDQILRPGGIADALDQVQAEGMARYVGFTALGDEIACLRVVESRRFNVVQSYYNLLNPSSGMAMHQAFYGQDFNRLIERASGAGMGVLAIRVMAGGALAGTKARQGHASPSVGGSMVRGASYDRDFQRAQAFNKSVAMDTRTPPQTAVRFVLDNALVSAALVGFTSSAQVDEIAACSDSVSVDGTTLKILQQLWATDFDLAASHKRPLIHPSKGQ